MHSSGCASPKAFRWCPDRRERPPESRVITQRPDSAARSGGSEKEKAFSEGGGTFRSPQRLLRSSFFVFGAKAQKTSQWAGGLPSLPRRPAPSRLPPPGLAPPSQTAQAKGARGRGFPRGSRGAWPGGPRGGSDRGAASSEAIGPLRPRRRPPRGEAGAESCGVRLLQHRTARGRNGTAADGSLEELVDAAAASAVRAGMEALSDAMQLQAQNASAAAAGIPEVASAVAAAEALQHAEENNATLPDALAAVAAAEVSAFEEAGGDAPGLEAAATSAGRAAVEAFRHAEEDNATLPDTLAAAAAAAVHSFAGALALREVPSPVPSGGEAGDAAQSSSGARA
ncbi:unnamed protein product [Prorocentrum cordatum]|uniref:Uncharacterized protein n=1 Tax=Prorocentrum cordatum TaxID=2364126 RepID=A0ABN9W737_9DINO|nr:unnamed protein product [Polarella glacialis]